jgi:DNA-binding XRE family transcriptional regulator
MISASNLIKWRKDNGYSQRQVAKMLGVGRGAVAHWEHDVKIPPVAEGSLVAFMKYPKLLKAAKLPLERDPMPFATRKPSADLPATSAASGERRVPQPKKKVFLVEPFADLPKAPAEMSAASKELLARRVTKLTRDMLVDILDIVVDAVRGY